MNVQPVKELKQRSIYLLPQNYNYPTGHGLRIKMAILSEKILVQEYLNGTDRASGDRES